MTTPQETPARRILVIDDNQAIHADFKKILGSSCPDPGYDAVRDEMFGASQQNLGGGFELGFAFQGAEGLERVKRGLAAGEPYAMAFIDVRMPPGWDGIETTLKLWEVCPDLQVVLCTAYSDYSWDETSARLGQSDRLLILKKPFDNIEVLQLAHALTEKWRLHQQAHTVVQQLEVMVQSRTNELHQTEERFRLITENATDLIALVTPDGRRLYSSPSYRQVLGSSPGESNVTQAFEEVHPEDRPQIVAAVRATHENAAGQILECRMQLRSGAWRVLESHISAVRNPRGEPGHVLLVARDITERKQAEHERQMMEVQLRQAQKLEAMGQLAAGIAHEINTPTQYVGDNVHFLKRAFADLNGTLEVHDQLVAWLKGQGPVSEEATQILNGTANVRTEYLRREIPKAITDALEGVNRVNQIVRAMKEFSHRGGEEKSPVDLNHAIQSTLTVSRNEWKYVAEMVTDFSPDLPPVPCLPGEFNQVVLNLVVNAAHAIADVVGDGQRPKGRITVITRAGDDWVEIRVQDTGQGIPVAVQHRIFEPFFTTKPVGKGSGQGLALARAVVVDRHGGTIRFETEAGRGTTFIIRLPLSATSKTPERVT